MRYKFTLAIDIFYVTSQTHKIVFFTNNLHVFSKLLEISCDDKKIKCMSVFFFSPNISENGCINWL